MTRHPLPASLAWQHFPSDETGFYHTPVLLTGAEEAVLLDGVFRFSQGRALAEVIRATGKRLTTIYVSCNDPDFYFGLGPVRDAFPEARIIAASETAQAIAENVDEKLAIWREALGDDGAETRADLALPVADDTDVLMLENERIEIVTAPGIFDRRYIWVPSLQGIFGGTLIVSGMHVWMADTPRPETIAAWIAALNEIVARNPAVVVPGHMTVDGPMGLEAVWFTRDYMIAFEKERAHAPDSAALIQAMEARYPGYAGAMWLELGAKVVKGEMQWGRAG